MSRTISWFIHNPIAANMLMIILLVGGFIGAQNVNNQYFPDLTPNTVSVIVAYPGAGPAEIEEQICIRVEQAITDVEGIKKVSSNAKNGVGVITIEASQGWPLQRLLSDVKTRVDAISTLPADAERPLVSENTIKRRTDQLVLFGNVNESELKVIGNEIKHDINQIRGVGSVDIYGERLWEVSIEVPPQTLLQYDLQIADITQAIRKHSVNFPAGEIKQHNSDIQLQVYGQAYSADDFGNIPVISLPDGATLRLKDIATIQQGFEDSTASLHFNKKRILSLLVYSDENPDFLYVSQEVEKYIAEKQASLPDGVSLQLLMSNTKYLSDRLDLLSRNALQGLTLVFIILMLFLSPSLAGWVVVGLATAYMGAFALMAIAGVSLSAISAFAFLLILGIVVDDAIIIGESAYAQFEKGISPAKAVEQGTHLVAKPVLFAVTTTMAVFIPGALLSSSFGQILAGLSMVAIFALLISLVESLWILPSHLRHMKVEKPPKNAVLKRIYQLRHRCSEKLHWFTHQPYAKWLEACLKKPFLTFASFTAAILIAFSLLIGGWININLIPVAEGEMVYMTIEGKDGLSDDRLRGLREQIESNTEKLLKDQRMLGQDGQSIVKNTAVRIAEGNLEGWLFLTPDSERSIGASKVAVLWEEYLGKFEHINSINISGNAFLNPGQKDISLILSGENGRQLTAAAEQIKHILASFPGVYGVSDSSKSGGREIELQLKPHADVLGIGLADLAQQVRFAFHGQEVQRIPGVQEEVKVMVRYPKDATTQIDTLEDMWIHTREADVPLSQLADIKFGSSSTEIKRVNRSRIIEIKANVREEQNSANDIIAQLTSNQWPTLQQQFPDLELSLGDQHKDSSQTANQLILGLMFVLLGVYAMFAIEFRSYIQPILILCVVPFGVAGAIIGHLLYGYTFSIPSFLGLLATSGVVINDNLVLIDSINRRRKITENLVEAIKEATKSRVRPILLTTATTFFGLMPILSEASIQAQFLKPMATALSFGVLICAPVTLLLVPVLYLTVERAQGRMTTLSRRLKKNNDEISSMQ